jgi:TorA maturation chaperone TorD
MTRRSWVARFLRRLRDDLVLAFYRTIALDLRAW